MKRLLAVGVALVGCAAASAQATGPCLFTAAEMSAATGRQIAEGVPTKEASGVLYCAYADVANPKRRIALHVEKRGAREWYESSKRLFHVTGPKPEKTALPGVGEDAFFTGVNAAAHADGVAVRFGTLRRGSEPKLTSEQVASLLKTALQRAR